MAQVDRQRNHDRAKAAVAVAAFHALLGYLFITGLGYEVAKQVSDNLRVFDVIREAPPPPIEEVQPAEKKSEAEGAAAPRNIKSKPTPVIAPPPKIRLDVPPPVRSAPLPSPVTGSDASAGASDVKGSGTGAGGVGTGTGSGGQGLGSGSGGASRAQLERGRLMNEDYPRAAMRAGAEGTVTVRYTVGIEGRVSGCTVTRSSGNDDLDTTTCSLIERRFRYRPAQDADGRPVPEVVMKVYEWLLPFKSRI